MNLRRLRVRLTAIYMLLSAVALALIAGMALELGVDNVEESARADVEELLVDAGFSLANLRTPTDRVWKLRSGSPITAQTVKGGEWSSDDPLDQALVDAAGPILGAVQGSGRLSTASVEIEGMGTWLFGGLPSDLEPDVVFAAAIDFEPYEQRRREVQLRIVLGALAALLVSGVAGWWFAGRSLQPALQALRQQRDFIADAAHELRTPLSVIQASASHALSRDRPAPEYRASLGEVRDAAQRAGEGVGELLELARLEAGQAKPRKAPLRLDLLIEEVAAGIRVDGVTVIAEPCQPVIAHADYNLMRQVVENVCRNAAARATQINLAVGADDRSATIVVADNGPGFSEDVMPRVFERWRRGDELGSTGLGMAIARSIVESHGGICEVSNAARGGAVVRLIIPLGEARKADL